MSNKYNPQPTKRRRLSRTEDIVRMLGPSRARPSAVLPKRCPVRPEVALAATRQQDSIASPDSSKNETKENSSSTSLPKPAPLPKLVDSPLSSENIEAALCLIDRNTKQKKSSFDEVLQAFHDLYRWSKLPNRDHRNFFRNEFVWELSGISRVMKFLKAHKMGDEFLRQLVQSELPFNE